MLKCVLLFLQIAHFWYNGCMETYDYVLFGVLIALCLAVGLAWILTKGRFVKYTREISEQEQVTLHKRSILAGSFFVAIAVVLAVSMVAMHFGIKWLMVTSFVVVLVLSVCFVVLSRIIYRRKR